MTDNNKDKDKQETVHMKCRVKNDITGESLCPGTEAVIKSKRRAGQAALGGGAHIVTYQCTTCNRPWTVSF